MFHIYILFLVYGNIYFEFESGYLILDLYALSLPCMREVYERCTLCTF